MKKKLIRRIATVGVAAALCVGACAMFAGCSSNHPEVTITYNFNEEDYKVTYTLSRVDAPNTVQHFIELANAGFYNELCIHDFDEGAYMFSGGYKIEDGDLAPVDYFGWAEEQKLTQTVWDKNNNPLNTVYGEFGKNGNGPENGRENSYRKGALVMYYTDKGTVVNNEKVITVRNDGGKGNDGNSTQETTYQYNSATSFFYTNLGSGHSSFKNDNYCIFGKVKDWDEMQALLDAIDKYVLKLTPESEDDAEKTADYSLFAEERKDNKLNQGDPIVNAVGGSYEATYNTPVEEPIIIKSVKVNKY